MTSGNRRRVGSITQFAVAASLLAAPAFAGEIGVRIGVSKTRGITVNPPFVALDVGDIVKWSFDSNQDGRVQEVAITVPAGPFGPSVFRGLQAPGSSNPTAPAVQAAASTITPYEIKSIGALGVEIESVTLVYVWVRGARDGVRKARGLLVRGFDPRGPWFQNDVDHLQLVLDDALTNNWAATPEVLATPTAQALATAIGNAAAGQDDDDIFLLHVSSHGAGIMDANNDEKKGDDNKKVENEEWCRQPECDEGLQLPNAEDADMVLDDALGSGVVGQALAAVKGLKVIILDACHSGGLVDRDLDHDDSMDLPIPNSIVITGCKSSNQRTHGDPLNHLFGHPHFYFTGTLIDGLLAADPFGPQGPPPPGKVNADDKRGGVTIDSWYRYARSQVAGLARSFHREQDVKLDRTLAPNGSRLSQIYDYTAISNHAHTSALRAQGNFAHNREAQVGGFDPRWPFNGCECDFGDAPDDGSGRYPTLEENGGCCHRTPLYEWLGTTIDTEEPGADPELDGMDLDGDLRDGDRYDDGVKFIRRSDGDVEIRVTVTVADRFMLDPFGDYRYEPSDPYRRLYLNAWADWEPTDGTWSSNEKISAPSPASSESILGPTRGSTMTIRGSSRSSCPRLLASPTISTSASGWTTGRTWDRFSPWKARSTRRRGWHSGARSRTTA